MPTPPAATRRWKAISSSLTTAPRVMPSKVAALIVRLRSVIGPSRAGSKICTADRVRSAGLLEAVARLVELGDQFVDELGDRAHRVHPADDLADRHRDHRRVLGLHDPLVRLADE